MLNDDIGNVFDYISKNDMAFFPESEASQGHLVLLSGKNCFIGIKNVR